MSEWIKTEEKKPFSQFGEGMNVLTIDNLGEMRIAYWDGGNWCWPTGECIGTTGKFPITYWMPLPEPPKNEQIDLIGDGKRCEEVCKHAPPEKWKWPCDDCDMRFHDRAEPPKEEDDE